MIMRSAKVWMAAVVVIVTLMVGEGRATDRGIDGLLLGAGGGALVGQAIGRDKEATLIGTAVGGMLGYMMGSEMDRGASGSYTVSHGGRYLPPPPPMVFSSTRYERDRDHYRDRRPGRVCWEEKVWVERRHGGYRPEWRTVCRDKHRHWHRPWHEDRHDRRW